MCPPMFTKHPIYDAPFKVKCEIFRKTFLRNGCLLNKLEFLMFLYLRNVLQLNGIMNIHLLLN